MIKYSHINWIWGHRKNANHMRACRKNLILYVEILTHRKYSHACVLDVKSQKKYSPMYRLIVTQIQWQLQTCNPTFSHIYFFPIFQYNHNFLITTSQTSFIIHRYLLYVYVLVSIYIFKKVKLANISVKVKIRVTLLDWISLICNC